MYPDAVLDKETFSSDWVEIERDMESLEWEELLLPFSQESETNSSSTFGKSS
jgi:hypothetical protein